MASEQDQFLSVVDRDTAERLWRACVKPCRLPSEDVPLEAALGRVLAADVCASVDVPGFDRSNFDGFAVRAEDTFDATEETPRRLALTGEELTPGVVPARPLIPRAASVIATGGMLPRNADAVAMIESTRIDGEYILISKPVAPGFGVSFAGTDIARGELVMRSGTRLTSRETGVLAAIGIARVSVVKRPTIAIISTGDELVPPGAPLPPGAIYDSNATILADAIREVGGEPHIVGIVRDDESELSRALDEALARDVVLISGGTSKGQGDISYRVLAKRAPGILVHGVALKPGKPICLGAVGTKPVAILPGFPTSAIFTFHEFVAPLIRTLAGVRVDFNDILTARLAHRVNSERGRTEYLLVNLITNAGGLVAYPMGKGSGSVTAFSRADGFVVIPRDQEYLEADEVVSVTPLAPDARPPDLVVIGSHCVGLDAILGLLRQRGISSKTIWVGSQGGIAAAARGECDVAGIHLFDPATGVYNTPFLPPGTRLALGYARMQGVVFRPGDRRFDEPDAERAVARALEDDSCSMVNRNRGSGTRVLIDRLLGDRRPPGFAIEARSHNAVAASVAQARADWGVAIAPVAAMYGLSFLPLKEEHYDFAVPESRWDRPAIQAFRDVLASESARELLQRLGFRRSAALNLLANVGGIILCGGHSTRMGRPKAWLPFGDEVLLQRVARLVRLAIAGPIVVVAAEGQELPPLPREMIIARDPMPDRGPLQGIEAGLAALPDDVELAFATATDVPFLNPAWIRLLVDRIGDHDIVLPETGGFRHPLAALYRRLPAQNAIAKLLSENRLRPVFLTEALKTLMLDEQELRLVDPDLGTLRNLNSPAEYRAALESAGLPSDNEEHD